MSSVALVMLPQLLLLAIVHVLFLRQIVVVYLLDRWYLSLRLEGVLHRIVMVLQAIHGLNLRLVSPRSHLGTSLLPPRSHFGTSLLPGLYAVVVHQIL